MGEGKTLAYREAAAQGATQIGLLIIAYDALARELSRAAEAVRVGNIHGRCQHSNKAIAILGHLQSWTEYLQEPALEAALVEFYSFLRSRITQLQRENSDREFDTFAKHVIETRITWQKKEQQHLASQVEVLGRAAAAKQGPIWAGETIRFRASA